jgi:hypothetical protein
VELMADCCEVRPELIVLLEGEPRFRHDVIISIQRALGWGTVLLALDRKGFLGQVENAAAPQTGLSVRGAPSGATCGG